MSQSGPRYALYGALGTGGMASVHLGRLRGAVGFTRTVAIKRLHPQYASDPDVVTRFVEEGRIAARIHHPNVVATLDVVISDGEPLLVMDYIHGEPLNRLITDPSDPIPPAILVAILSNVLHGLHAAHEAVDEQGKMLGLVHRDVSPHNIIVGVDGVARVLDFGIAKAFARTQATRDGVKGKLAYMAPEQIKELPLDRRTDVYAASVVLWEAIVMRRLFDADNAGAVVEQLLSAPIVRPSEARSGAPHALDAVVMRGLARDRRARFATARDMAVALEAAVPQATAADVGRWLELRARPALAERTRRVREVESGSALGGTLVDAHAKLPRHLERALPSAPMVPRSRFRVAVLIAALTLIVTSLLVFALRPNRLDAGTACDKLAAVIDARHPLPQGRYGSDDAAAFKTFAEQWRGQRRAACVRAAESSTPTNGRESACLDDALHAYDRAIVDNSVLEPGLRPALPRLARCAADSHELLIRKLGEASLGVKEGMLVSPDGKWIATAGQDRRLLVQTLDDAQPIANLELPDYASLESWPEQDRIVLAAGAHEGTARGYELVADLKTMQVARGSDLPNGSWCLSNDGARIAAVEAGELHVDVLRDGTRTPALARFGSTATSILCAWSPDDRQLAIYDPPELAILDVATKKLVRFDARLVLTSSPSIVWANPRTLLFTGRSDSDRGTGIWSVGATRGEIDRPVALELAGPPSSGYFLESAGGGHVMAQVITSESELARLVDEQTRRIAHVPAVRWLYDVDPRGEHALVGTDTAIGTVSFTDGSFVQLLGRRLAGFSTAYNGGRILALDGDKLVELRPAGPRVLASAGGMTNLSCTPHDGSRCVAWRSTDNLTTIASIGDAGLGPTLRVATGAIDVYGSGAISRDGGRLALSGMHGHIAVVDIASGKLQDWQVPLRDDCRYQTTSLAWAQSDDAVYVSVHCGSLHSRLYRVDATTSRSAFGGTTWIAGMATDPTGDVIANLRQYTSETVVIDGLGL